MDSLFIIFSYKLGHFLTGQPKKTLKESFHAIG